jgi:hypothetical protein
METLKDILSILMDVLPGGGQIKRNFVLMLWEKVVGPDIAKNTMANFVRGGVLFVTARNSMWANQLSFLRSSLIKKLNNELGEDLIRDIRFQTGFVEDISREIERDMDVEIIPETYQEVGQLVASLSDKDVSSAFASLYVSHKGADERKKRRGWKRCRFCSALYQDHRDLCPICNLSIKGADLSKLKELLYELPWLDYEGTSKILPQFTEIQYKGAVEEIKSDIKAILKINLGKYIVEKDDIIRERSLELLAKYQTLVKGEDASALDEAFLSNELGPGIRVLF